MAVLLILALGVATYGTRIAGHLVLSRFERLNPRVEAALDAVPIAVITALVAPAVLARSYADAKPSPPLVVTVIAGSLHRDAVIGAVTVSLLRDAA